ncbi:flagellar basal body P-ring formation chaperone FlgA [Pseudovibrio sp. SPO723]|uniref:flagellar basal body P-ring formation chaperone FlgA n=1 Tax=Nesiotobacter zosterae TaxID=392721 RepID=UPI0029C499C3|nr:flagellar basal body P-ring formation chaperone FlgA [Pseudovibrio sp. SPO723]MDX5594152.1 flagellar basal body P-ring formation chaperone FlgA [Pseudovibrio sp. SPO723]
MTRSLILAFSLLLGLTTIAAAAPVLRSHVIVNGPIVTIGDFYEDAGEFAQTAIFRAPDHGKTGEVPARLIARQAQDAGFWEAATNGLEVVTVHRASVEMTGAMISKLVKGKMADRLLGNDNDIELRWNTPLPAGIHGDAGVANPISLTHLNWAQSNGQFRATFSVVRDGRAQTFALDGQANIMVEVTTLARRVKRGDIISSNDLRIERVPAQRMTRRAALDATQAVGQAARRSLRAGTILTENDITAPLLVKRGENIMVTYAIPGMQLTTIGRANADGAMGDIIEIKNMRSNKVVLGTVTGSGRAHVSNLGQSVASLNEARP